MVEVETPPCSGCGLTTWFVMTKEQLSRWRGGEHIQYVLPDWSAEDREMLISGTCPTCFEEMFPEEEEEDWYIEDDGDYAVDPESDLFEYERDWYVD